MTECLSSSSLYLSLSLSLSPRPSSTACLSLMLSVAARLLPKSLALLVVLAQVAYTLRATPPHRAFFYLKISHHSTSAHQLLNKCFMSCSFVGHRADREYEYTWLSALADSLQMDPRLFYFTICDFFVIRQPRAYCLT